MQKVFIDLPPYAEQSNGVKCIYDLALHLFLEGIPVVALPRSIPLYTINQSKLKSDFHSIPFDVLPYGDEQNFLIACDTTPKKILISARKLGLKIIWWQLAPYCLLGGKSFPEIGDINLPFSSYCDPSADQFCYYQSKIDKIWLSSLKYKANNKRKNKRICIYTGKGRLKILPKNIRNLFSEYDIQLITRVFPAKRKELFYLLLNSDAFISFDELTQINLEAASLGMPVFIANPLFPEQSLRRFSIPELQYRMTTDSETFIKLLFSQELEPLSEEELNPLKNTSFNKIIKIIKNEHKPIFVDHDDIKNFQKFTTFLKNKKAIFPHINEGQSGGTLLIDAYMTNLVDAKKDNLIMYKIRLLDHFFRLSNALRVTPILVKLFLLINNFYMNLPLQRIIYHWYRHDKKFNKMKISSMFKIFSSSKELEFGLLQKFNTSKLSFEEMLEKD